MAADRRLTPYARLPRAHHGRTVLHSTVDAFGRAHWLLRGATVLADLYDAVVVTVDAGRSEETHLSSVRARFPLVDALPDGGFVVADARSRADADQVHIFDALGRPTWGFTVGDAVGHLLTDESGDLWVGYFDEGVVSDPLSEPGVRRWSSTGTPAWQYGPQSGIGSFLDCYALNVGRRATWVYPYTDFPLLEVRDGRPPHVRTAPVRGASGVAVHGEHVAFYGGYADDGDRLVLGKLTDSAVEPEEEVRLLRSDGSRSGGPRRVVSRGSRVYVQEEPFTEWGLLDIG
ncbi:hypothetical protein ACFYWX_26970 [Streptomyces sp. NPDC002888]|uniref:hypothetical protein n=1 Tax=Streptomyces sp. NPDC002888 TaxID=3364668 RepID=UPI00367F63C8